MGDEILTLKGKLSDKYVPDTTELVQNIPLVKGKANIAYIKDSINKVAKIKELLLKGRATPNSTKKDLANIFNVSWGAKYLYMVRLIGGLESPLGDYVIPASNVSEQLSGINTMEIPLPTHTGFKIPISKSIPEISITMYDTEDCLIERHLRKWILESHDGVTCNYVDDCARELIVYKLDYSRDIVLESTYQVIPNGDVKIDMSSKDSSARELTLNLFVIDYD